MRLALVLFAFCLAACGSSEEAPAEATATETRTVRLDGRQLALDGFAGEVSLVAVPGLKEAEVTFTKRVLAATASRAEGRLREIEIREAGDDALYQFVWRTEQEGASVDAEVRVPFSADVVVRLGAGSVTANALRGPLDVELGSGSIRASHLRSSEVRLETGAGDVTAGAAFLSPNADWRVETGSGRLTLLAPATASVRIQAESRAGSLDLDPDLPLGDIRQSGGPAGVDVRAVLGEGSARIRATTGAGDIEILRYKEPAPESQAARETAPVRQDTTLADSTAR